METARMTALEDFSAAGAAIYSELMLNPDLREERIWVANLGGPPGILLIP
jgi:hypothetical protein